MASVSFTKKELNKKINEVKAVMTTLDGAHYKFVSHLNDEKEKMRLKEELNSALDQMDSILEPAEDKLDSMIADVENAEESEDHKEGSLKEIVRKRKEGISQESKDENKIHPNTEFSEALETNEISFSENQMLDDYLSHMKEYGEGEAEESNINVEFEEECDWEADRNKNYDLLAIDLEEKDENVTNDQEFLSPKLNPEKDKTEQKNPHLTRPLKEFIHDPEIDAKKKVINNKTRTCPSFLEEGVEKDTNADTMCAIRRDATYKFEEKI